MKRPQVLLLLLIASHSACQSPGPADFRLTTEAPFSGNGGEVPLGIADGGITNGQLANPSFFVTATKPLAVDTPMPTLGGHLMLSCPFCVTKDEMGNVGIGTSTPRARLDVWATGSPAVILTNSQNSGIGQSVGMEFQQMTTEGTEARLGGSIQSLATGSYTGGNGASYRSDLVLFSAALGALVEGLRITSEGNVAIGTKTPNLFGAIVGTFLTIAGKDDAQQEGRLELASTHSKPAADDLTGGIYFVSQNLPTEKRAATIYSNLEGQGGGSGFGARLTFSTKGDNASLGSGIIVLTSDGSTGIGTKTPRSRIHVKQPSNDIKGGLALEGSDATTACYLFASDAACPNGAVQITAGFAKRLCAKCD